MQQTQTTLDWIEIGTVSDIPRRGARCVNTVLGARVRRNDDRKVMISSQCIEHRDQFGK